MILERLGAFLAASEFSWRDALDILIVAFIIYELLQFIRGTHAVQMALGALVLVILYWTSTLFDLQTVNWLLRTFLPYVVFGIIVVFQSEIRKVLAHLGKTPLLGAPPEERLLGTAAASAAAVLGGAHVLRVHDVREMAEVARVCDAILGEA